MSKLKANINIKDFEEFKVLHDIFHKMLNDENINVGIRLKYIHEFNNKIEKENNMNVSYVRVNNQKEFERVVAKMERETGFKWENKSSIDNLFNIIGVHIKTKTLTLYNSLHPDNKNLIIISAHEYLKTFTLSDLTDGMVIAYRDGDRRLFM